MADEVSMSIPSILNEPNFKWTEGTFPLPPFFPWLPLVCSAFLNPRLNFCLCFLGEYVSRSNILFLLFFFFLPLFFIFVHVYTKIKPIYKMRILAQMINNTNIF